MEGLTAASFINGFLLAQKFLFGICKGEEVPDISSISTCEALSFSVRVFSREDGVMPEESATEVAWVSVSAAPVVILAGERGKKRD